ncbi:MAG: hypothetical protein ACREEM_10100 [Blastocatellia bacterium]
MFAISIEKIFDLHFANGVRFVPVNLGRVDCIIIQSDTRNAFQFTPAPFAKLSIEKRKLINASTDSDRFGLSNPSNQCKISERHMRSLTYRAKDRQ